MDRYSPVLFQITHTETCSIFLKTLKKTESTLLSLTRTRQQASKMFSKDWLRVIEIIPVRYESANGVVLTGDVMRLARCFRRYVKSETSTIHRIIQRNVGTIEVRTEVIVDLFCPLIALILFSS